MRISARTEYAVLALLEMADREGDRPLQSKDIASQAGVPKPFLDQLLLDLRRGGLVRSVRGPGGGYAPARSAREITLREAVAAVEGGSLNTQCGIKAQDGVACRRATLCALLDIWREIDGAMNQILEKTTLADLRDRQRQLDGRQMYYI